MTVTNTIRDDVEYNDELGEWKESELSNNDIIEKLDSEEKKAFLSFRLADVGVPHGRVTIYCVGLQNQTLMIAWFIGDTDSLKLCEGYDKKVFLDYNEKVKSKIEFASNILSIPIERYMPKDKHGNAHMLGIFEYEGKYDEFITQGAKKYAVTKWKKNKKIKDDDNVIEIGEEQSKVLEITVAGVPKTGAKCLNEISDFKDDLVFDFEHTNKNTLFYCENQDEFDLTDYQGNTYHVTDKTGCCLVPTTYVLGKALEYAEFIEDESSKRAWFKE